MPDTIDPTLAAAIGQNVHAAYLTRGTGGNVEHLYGRLAIELDQDDAVSAVVIEGDGSATRVALPVLIVLEVEA